MPGVPCEGRPTCFWGVDIGVVTAEFLCRRGFVERRSGFLWFLLGLHCLPAVPDYAAGFEDRLPAVVTPVVGGEIELTEADETWEAAQQELARAPDEPAALRALVTVVNLQRRRGDLADGVVGARDGLERARRLGDRTLQVDFLYLLGRIYWALSDYPRSLEHHLEELRVAETLADAGLLSRTHGGLAMTYFRYGRNDDARQHINRGLELAAEANDERMRGSLLNSLGNYHLAVGDYAAAAATHGEALRIREALGNRRAIAETLTNLGLVADALGERATARDYLLRALGIFESLRYRRNIASTHTRLATVLRRAGRVDEALTHLQSARHIAETLDSAELRADLHRELALTQEARGNLAAALDSQRQLAAATDEVRREADRRRMDELRARYRDEQRELQITLLERDRELGDAELARQRSQTLALAGGLVGGVTLLGAVIFVQLARLRAERRLRAATEQARIQAEAAERLKSRLLQMASHDLKVPLAALHATAGMIARTPSDAEAVRRLATGIQQDSARMRTLVRDFLDVAAMEDGNLQLQTTELELPPLVSAAVEALRPVALQKGQRIEVAAPVRPLAPVEADAGRLRQVFDNLIGNALKFTPAGGEIQLVLGEAGGWAYAEVRDSGPGLGPDDFARIFGPQRPLPARSLDPQQDSSGLGLFIVRELLNRQGGRLEVESQPRRGAVFRVLLPVAGR